MGVKIGKNLSGINNCPHCSIARPSMRVVWSTQFQINNDFDSISRADGNNIQNWMVYSCSNCGALLTVECGNIDNSIDAARVRAIYPEPKQAHADLPEIAKTFLQQAFETLHAPDAAAVMAGSAVDAMLKAKDYTDGSLYHRIDKACDDHLLTKGMADWAHEVRLGSNRPRHADEKRPHVSHEEAKQSVEFAEALGQFLFVLTAKMDRAILKAKEISED